MKGLYVHIPFCKSKCFYCDFNSIVNDMLQDEYVDVLLKEIDSLSEENFDTIFIGGGTPTILSIKNLQKLLNKLSRFNPIEYTIEANPGTLNKEKLILLKNYGINRLSLGLQSVDDKMLKKLGRIHKYEDFLKNYFDARDVGFTNINVDIMFNLPNQTKEEFMFNLYELIKINPEHISCYSLIIEEGTKFYEMHVKNELMLLDEEEERLIYHEINNVLKQNGYIQYEISNYAKKGYECKHNIIYWTDEEYIGVGAGAHSYYEGKRFNNISNVYEYINKIKLYNSAVEECINLTEAEHMSEFIFLGLRMNRGININQFKSKFNKDIMEIYSKEINELINNGLIEKVGENIRLTEKGRDLSNLVFVSFIK
ncbi:radical SAM family heme chaperone HemW [Thermobrachium celere]|uniref:radical SAM family heme chaperone HemW n=1 Tax=Thermobrachium celere TaxID=53422 RepID=UPI00194196C1|nr:radical SAM family heme chaperone HemW [Thermobrachium celere]GFR34524.1 coproporphyrinogen III oxidase [Thermobrachium celere]